MKKLFVVLVVGILALSLVGCSSDEDGVFETGSKFGTLKVAQPVDSNTDEKIEDATIKLEGREKSSEGFETRLSSGTYTLTVVKEGYYAPGTQNDTKTINVTIKDGKTNNVKPKLAPKAKVKIPVPKDSNDNFLYDSTVQLVNNSDLTSFELDKKNDQFVGKVPAGTYNVQVSKTGYTLEESSADVYKTGEFEVKAGEEVPTSYKDDEGNIQWKPYSGEAATFVDDSGPIFSEVSITGDNTIELVFSEEVLFDDSSGFNATIDGTSTTVDNITIKSDNPDTLELTLADSIAVGAVVEVTYNADNGNLKDAAGIQANSFTGSAKNPLVTLDGTNTDGEWDKDTNLITSLSDPTGDNAASSDADSIEKIYVGNDANNFYTYIKEDKYSQGKDVMLFIDVAKDNDGLTNFGDGTSFGWGDRNSILPNSIEVVLYIFGDRSGYELFTYFDGSESTNEGIASVNFEKNSDGNFTGNAEAKISLTDLNLTSGDNINVWAAVVDGYAKELYDVAPGTGSDDAISDVTADFDFSNLTTDSTHTIQ